jgi:8-oxo-dGTP diphosphatase
MSDSGVHNWVVGGGLILGDAGLLMVRNRRRDGSHDWSPPGGVIEPGESIVAGLTREVVEETGVEVLGWNGPVYEVHVEAPDMGWRARIEVHVAQAYQGVLRVDDPDGIVVDAAWVSPELCEKQMEGCRRWVSEPLLAWLGGTDAGTTAWPSRAFRYHLAGRDPATAKLTLL